MFACRVPRQGRASEWFDWPSGWLAQTAGRHKIAWLSQHVLPADRVVELDLATSQVRRTLCTRGSTTLRAMTISPDGSGLFLNGSSHRAVDRISTWTGRRVDSALVPSTVASSPGHGGIERPVVFGFSPDGSTAYFQVADDRTAATIAFAWHLASGRVEEVARSASDVETDSHGRSLVWPRRYYLRGGGSPVRFISAPDFLVAYQTNKYELRLQEPGQPERKLPVVQTAACQRTPALTPDGRRLFLTHANGDHVHGLDLDTGEDLGPLGVSASIWGDLAISTDGSLLIVPVVDPSFLVRDLEHRRWLARLRYPSDLFGPTPVLLPNGRWLAAVCLCGRAGNSPPPGGHLRELVLYDLAPVRAAQQRAGSPDHDEPTPAAPAGTPRP